MDRERAVHALPRVFAALVLVASLTTFLPGVRLPLPFTAVVAVPLALVVAVVARAAVTRAPVDITLAAFTVPCVLTVAYALYEHFVLTPGVVWGPLFVLLATALLLLAILADTAVERLADTRTAA
ncbi:hypothetical protein U3A55_04435 [Salarchaeum sp. III]|uniref:hypothetical protein n=1 Tax=Salarchaeum sp. III TaxID=3107927 RepID=UPI002EDB5645